MFHFQKHTVPAALVATVLVTMAAPASPSDGWRHPAPTDGGDRVGAEVPAWLADGPARVIVSLHDPASPQGSDDNRAAAIAEAQEALLRQVEASAARGDVALVHRYEYIPAVLAVANDDGVAALAASPLVNVIQPDRIERPLLAEHVAAVGGDKVHSLYGLTGEGVNVAVFDTGIDSDHPDLEDDIVAQQCYSANGGCPPYNATESSSAEDEDGHGTSVSGIITSRGTVSSVGIAPDAGIVAVRVFDDSVSAATSDMLRGFDWLIRNRRTLDVKLVNMSLGGGKYTGNCDHDDQARADAISELNRYGIAVFAASGNDGETNALAAPACISNVIAVGATYDDDLGRQPPKGTWGSGCFDETTSRETIACFSNVSRALSLVAPGVSTTSTARNGGTGVSAGTSNASPMAAGVAALVLQADDGIRPAQLKRLLETTGTLVKHPTINLRLPLVNALAAIEEVVGPTPSPTPTLEPTATRTVAPTVTATQTAEPSATSTEAATPTDTAAPSETAQPSSSPSPSPPSTQTLEATRVPTTGPVDEYTVYLPKADNG